MSQGLRNIAQANEKIEQCNYEVIGSLAALCRYFPAALLAKI